MSTTPLQIEGQARILLIETDVGRARQLLCTFSEAGLDCRYSPTGATGLSACEESHPHVVIIDESVDDTDVLILCSKLHTAYTFPIIILTANDDANAGHKYQHAAAHTLPRTANPRAVLSAIGALLHSVYRYEAVLSGEEIPSNIVPAPPPGWGRCEGCGYMGPRVKFHCVDRASSHSLTCPACKVSGNVTFSVS